VPVTGIGEGIERQDQLTAKALFSREPAEDKAFVEIPRFIFAYFLPMAKPCWVSSHGGSPLGVELTGSVTAPTHLLIEHLFNLSYFPLRLAGELFNLAFGSQVGIVCDLAHLLFDGSLRFVQSASDFVLHALRHLDSPLSVIHRY
jgi:hypothetical protein